MVSQKKNRSSSEKIQNMLILFFWNSLFPTKFLQSWKTGSTWKNIIISETISWSQIESISSSLTCNMFSLIIPLVIINYFNLLRIIDPNASAFEPSCQVKQLASSSQSKRTFSNQPASSSSKMYILNILFLVILKTELCSSKLVRLEDHFHSFLKSNEYQTRMSFLI